MSSQFPIAILIGASLFLRDEIVIAMSEAWISKFNQTKLTILSGWRQNLYVLSLYRNPDLDYLIFVCLQHQWLLCRLRMSVLLSCLCLI